MEARPRVFVLGAGGLGGYLGAVLHRGGATVHLVARGAHLEAMRADGLRVVEGAAATVEAIPVSTVLPPVGAGDLVLLTVKAHALQSVGPSLAVAAEAGAWIVPLVNGVDALPRLREGGVPPQRTILGVAYVTAFRTAPGTVERRGDHGRLVVGLSGEGTQPTSSSALDAFGSVSRILNASRIEVVESPHIELEAWKKMLVVTALVGGCLVGAGGIGRVLEEPQGRREVRGLVAEAARVARASGIDLPVEVEAAAFERVCAFRSDFRPSLIHDLESGVPTEVDALNGAIVRMGTGFGVPTPLHERAVQMVRSAEAAGAMHSVEG